MTTLEQVLCDRRFFDLPATPVQRAIARAADGRELGELASDSAVADAFGGTDAIAALPIGQMPARVDVYSGIRTAKSLIASAAAVCMSQRVDVSMCRAGETPRIPIVSLDRDKADVVFQHIVGTIMARPILKALLVGEPTNESIVLRHPSGVPVEIAPVAGKRAGGHLVARWLAGVIFDEAPRMLGSEDGAVVNIEDAIVASAGRILPGGQTWVIGSPWAPWGECFESVRQFWGQPSRDRIVVKAPAYAMNPVWWTPKRCADLRASNPRAYKTDVLAEFADASASALESEWVDRAFRAPLPFVELTAPIGVIDSSAGGGDAFVWCLAQWCIAKQTDEFETYIAEDGAECYYITQHGQYVRKPQQPAQPFMRMFGWDGLEGRFRDSYIWDRLLDKMADHFRAHGATRAVGDKYQELPMMSGMRRRGIEFTSQNWSSESKSQALGRIKTWFRDGQIVIAGGTENATIRRELVQLQATPKSGGGETIGARHKGHDDRAALVLNAGMLDVLGEFRGSPVAIPRGLVVDAPGQPRRRYG